MAKNKRRQSASVAIGPAVKALLICMAVADVGVGYVWQRHEIFRLGQQKKAAELRIDELRRQNDGLKRALAAGTTPRELDARVKKMNLGLAAPQHDQIIRLGIINSPVRPPEPSALYTA